ncbi:hypothetical protein Hanom_Chr07g00591041 [Helianthus anomalus]
MDDLKRVTINLSEERVLWARDIAEKDRVLAHAKNVQEELERKVVTEAQKVRSELSTKIERFRIDTDFVSQVQERYQALTVEVEASNAKAQAKQVELEERDDQLRNIYNKIIGDDRVGLADPGRTSSVSILYRKLAACNNMCSIFNF